MIQVASFANKHVADMNMATRANATWAVTSCRISSKLYFSDVPVYDPDSETWYTLML